MKKIVKYLSPLSILPTILVASQCSDIKTADIHKEEQKIINNVENFQNFINQKGIQALLKLAFPDEKQRNEYIKYTSNIPDSYANKVSMFLRYGNVILAPNIVDFLGKRAYPAQFSSKEITNLERKNWLWYLFNLNNFTFMQYKDSSDSDYFNDVSKNNISFEESVRLYKLFYKPSSNRIVNYTIVETANSEEDDERLLNFIFLNEDGYIIQVKLETTYNSQSNFNIKVNTHIHTFPDLVTKKVSLKEFDLNKFARAISHFNGLTEKQSNSREILFSDEYGGAKLAYIPVNFNNNNAVITTIPEAELKRLEEELNIYKNAINEKIQALEWLINKEKYEIDLNNADEKSSVDEILKSAINQNNEDKIILEELKKQIQIEIQNLDSIRDNLTESEYNSFKEKFELVKKPNDMRIIKNELRDLLKRKEDLKKYIPQIEALENLSRERKDYYIAKLNDPDEWPEDVVEEATEENENGQSNPEEE
ncbi:Uncharacterised protein [Mycoplasmopsis maculosa]|uniref:Uncharacterized protein n=1 Tax=Mycoplasmopsis maculosa TaxID=114885 RepID=A0A449B4W7_9BACT|nr:aromatic motif membrane protein [Mycoplasmopsis maculosa]VEU75632.1 Uncharacterised protein [Mycoplasmopsis maculosa]